MIVDTPPALAETVLAAFDLSDMLYVMATLDLPSVRNMSVFLGTLERLKVPTDNVRLDPQQGRERRRHRHRPGHQAVPAGLRVGAALRQGGEPVHQPRHAGDGRLPHRRDQHA